jgi:transposase
MRKIIEVLRLRFEAGFTHERIAAATRISKGAVTEYLRRAHAAGVGWPPPAELDDAQLEALLFPRAAPHVERHATPDFAHIHQELKRKGVTLMLLWEEYAAAHAGQAYRYSQFCLLYHRFAAGLKRSMRQVHRAGEKLFIDYSGQTVSLIDAATGEIHRAQIFVAVLGASSYTYAEATMTQQLPDWIGSHVRLFEFLGGVPALLVPDQLKSAIRLACRYEPECTSTYEDLARHYATAVLPARPQKPRDKAAVENSVLVVQRWILARLRNRQFFSLAALNAAIRELLVELNERPFKKLEGCRASAFETIDRPAMKPRCRRPVMNSPPGRRCWWASITTSSSTATTTACRTAWSNTSSSCAPRPVLSNASSAASGSLHMCAPRNGAGTRRSACICPSHTAATWSGRQGGC